MKVEPSSYFVNKVVPLKESVKEFLHLKNSEEYDTSRKSKCTIQGGVLSDIRYSWLCRGSKLEVIHTKTGSKVAAWSFGTVVHDFETFVTCVTELPRVEGKLPLLVIGLECEIGGGMICMFDINSSRVIRAIQIDDRVTSIHVINPGCDSSFPGALRAMDGVLAVGTGKGKIILIDLCRQICEEAGPEYVRDEINACHLTYLQLFELKNLELHKERSLNTGNHLAVQINETSTSGIHFGLHGPNGQIRLHANMEEVAISGLHYCPQLGSLLVGFNFGAFQIYNLLNIQLEYTSPVCDDCIPITHFAIQEPCDDPRAFSYIWVVYNNNTPSLEEHGNGFPMAVMYALAYDTKDFLEGYGYLYQDFNSCSARFQIELTAVPGFHLAISTGARCISLNAYTSLDDDDKLALCSIVWTAWNNKNTTETYFTLFDLNQWYKAQMPSTTRLENHDAISYMSCESLSSQEEQLVGGLGLLLDVRLDRNTLCPFVCPQRLDEHYYPTALAFQLICLQDISVIWLGNYGRQKHLLSQLEAAGPLRLIRPTDLFLRCIELGLIPQYTADVIYSVSTPLNVQREMILNVALEQQLVRWLCQCARDWSTGSQSMAGCTLDMLLDWAWQRANTLKYQSDKLCIPLFDHKGLRMDSNAKQHLNHCTMQIKHLTTLFSSVLKKCCTFLNEQDIDDIKYQWRALDMMSIYLEVLQWLLNVGLLPEFPLDMYPLPDEEEKISAPYPADSLTRFYEARRLKLQSEWQNKNRLINRVDEEYSNLLFIDHLIDIECNRNNNNILHNQWECDGGNGLYPPPSLQAVLRTYLIEDIDIVHKHCLLMYLFLDLAMTLDQSRYKAIITHLIKFPAVFKLSPSVIKITQAMWQLDHEDFSTAMTQLLDPSINNEDLKAWHHRIILKTLLLQGQHQHALLYQQVRNPPVSSIEDMCIIITLLIVNDLLQEAFHFQRYNRSNFNEKQILNHFFMICERMNQQASVLHLPLCPVEEKQFIEYLKSKPSENNKNFLVIYYLQRDRYGEAFQINDYLNNNEIFKQGLVGQQDNNFRNAIVSGFKKTLPEVTQQLLDYCKNEKKDNTNTNKNKNVRRPVPMSVYVHDSRGQTKYKSTLIQASFKKAEELWAPNHSKNDLNNTPFISTPKVYRFSAERKNSSIIYPAILNSSNMETLCQNENEIENLDEGATPAKRMKFIISPRRSINESSNHLKKRLSCYNSDSLLSTPIVKRRSIRNESFNNNSVKETPPSILKVRSLLRNSISPENNIRETSTTPELIEPIDDTKKRKRTSFGICPRKPIPRTPRPIVHFEEERSNSRSSNESNQEIDVHVNVNVHREQEIDSKSSSRSTEDDVFYSPNSSINQSNESTEEERRNTLKRKANDSIASRKSYKSPPKEIRIEMVVTKEELSPPPPPPPPLQSEPTQMITRLKSSEYESPKIVPKVSGRRSLSRQVLENNLFSKVVSSSTPTPARMSTRLSQTKLTDSDKKKGVQVSYSKNTTSIVKIVTDDKIEETCDIKMIEKKDDFCSEKMDDSESQIIKHIHNEVETKSNVTKVTEIIQDVVDVDEETVNNNGKTFDQTNVLSFNSDTSESDVSHFYTNITHPDTKRYSVLQNKLQEQENVCVEQKEISHVVDDDDDDDDASSSEEEKISNQDDNDDEINQQIELNSEKSEEEIITEENEDSSSEVSSQSSDVILIKSSSDRSNSSQSDKNELLSHDDEPIEDEEESSDNINEQESNESSNDEENNFTLTLDESLEKQEIMKDINEDNADMDKNNEFFINEDINEMENVEFINDGGSQIDEQIEDVGIQKEVQQLFNDMVDENNIVSQTNKQIEDSILHETTQHLNPLETNVMEISEQTMKEDSSINNLEQNIIEITDATINSPANNTINPLEQNIAIEISETTIQHDQDKDEDNNEEMEASTNPLEKNVLEISETTIQHDQDEDEDKNEEMEASMNPLEKNVIEISETTIQHDQDEDENEDENEKSEALTTNPLEQNVIEISETTIKHDQDEDTQIIPLEQTPARRTRSASQNSESKSSKTPTRSSTRRRSIDVQMEEKTAPRITKKSILEPRKTRASSVISLDIIEEDKPMSRTRRATSVDTHSEIKEKRNQRRGQSLEPETTTTTTMKRGRKRALLSEQQGLQSIPEKIEEYSSTHRLTRHQKSIMEQSLIKQQKSRLEELSETETFDPIKLLDKKSFTGSPDKDEEFRPVSPASSVSSSVLETTAATPKRKRGRPPSSSGTPGSCTNSGSTERPRRRSFTQAQQAMTMTTPTRTRSRRSSRNSHDHDQDDATSVSSAMSVPIVQLRQLTDEIALRHRSLSPTALDDQTKNRRRSTRSTIHPTNLSNITEESTVENIPRRGRPRKTTEGSSSQRDSSGLMKTRRSSYKPLAKYLPEHSAVKTRKTFSMRKFSRGGGGDDSSSP